MLVPALRLSMGWVRAGRFPGAPHDFRSSWGGEDPKLGRGSWVKTSQHVLIAGPLVDVHAGLPAALKSLDLLVSRATSFEIAHRAVERAHDLSLVVIDGTASPEQAAALSDKVKDLHRRLPVLWIGAAPRSSTPPDARVAPTATISELEERAKALIIDDLYPPRLVRSFVAACNVALTTMFDCTCELAVPTLSRSAVLPGNVTAFMLMNSDVTSAHLALSSDETTLCALGYRIGFEESEGRRRLSVDMASELANQIMGRMKATSEFLEVLQLSLPYVFAGENVSAFAPTGKPSLTLQLTCNDPKGTLNVDFWFKTKLQPSPEAEAQAAELADAGLLFV